MGTPLHPSARRVGPYELVGELGRGSFGVVHRARRADLPGREFALKVVREDPGDPVGAERFLREAQVASRLRHPGIVSVLDHGRGPGFLYEVMEVCQGPTLRERLRRGGALPPGEAVALACALGEALDHAHRRGVVHRDLKPENVLLVGDRPRITDFGLARDEAAATSLTRTGEVLGTPYYMAPEQLLGRRDVDRRADVHALGVVLFECLTGRRPFEGPTLDALARQVTEGPRPAPSALAPGLPPGLDAVCARALALAPEDRFPDAAALVAALRGLRGDGETVADDAAGAAGAAGAGAGRSRGAPAVAVGVALLAACALAGGVAVWVATAPPPPAPEAGAAGPGPDPGPGAPPPAAPPPVAPPPVAPPPAPGIALPAPEGAPPASAPPPRRRLAPPGAEEEVAPRRALVDALTRPDGPGGAPVREPRLADALRVVPRHVFVADDRRAQAYQDDPLPFYEGRSVAKPSLMAVMIQQLAIGPADRVLELGTCSGWQTALLAHLAASVHSVEPSEALFDRAVERLRAQGYDEVHLRRGDPAAGWPEAAPFDAVLVTGALPEVPPAVWEQLRVGGRIVLPLAPPGQPQRLVALVKRGPKEAERAEMGGIAFHLLPRG